MLRTQLAAAAFALLRTSSVASAPSHNQIESRETSTYHTYNNGAPFALQGVDGYCLGDYADDHQIFSNGKTQTCDGVNLFTLVDSLLTDITTHSTCGGTQAGNVNQFQCDNVPQAFGVSGFAGNVLAFDGNGASSSAFYACGPDATGAGYNYYSPKPPTGEVNNCQVVTIKLVDKSACKQCPNYSTSSSVVVSSTSSSIFRSSSTASSRPVISTSSSKTSSTQTSSSSFSSSSAASSTKLSSTSSSTISPSTSSLTVRSSSSSILTGSTTSTTTTPNGGSSSSLTSTSSSKSTSQSTSLQSSSPSASLTSSSTQSSQLTSIPTTTPTSSLTQSSQLTSITTTTTEISTTTTTQPTSTQTSISTVTIPITYTITTVISSTTYTTTVTTQSTTVTQIVQTPTTIIQTITVPTLLTSTITSTIYSTIVTTILTPSSSIQTTVISTLSTITIVISTQTVATSTITSFVPLTTVPAVLVTTTAPDVPATVTVTVVSQVPATTTITPATCPDTVQTITVCPTAATATGTCVTTSTLYPYLLVPVASASPQKSYGSVYTPTIDTDTALVAQFGVPDNGLSTCSLEFHLPGTGANPGSGTSSYALTGTGSIIVNAVNQISSSSTYASLIFNTTLGSFALQEGSTVRLGQTFPCSFASSIAFELVSNRQSVTFFEDCKSYCPSPEESQLIILDNLPAVGLVLVQTC